MKNREKEVILLHREMSGTDGRGRVDIVLSPQLYVVKKEEIPLRFSFQAVNIAPSVLEESVRGDRELRYEVAPTGEGGWYFFAYDPEEIRELLKEKGIAPSRVGTLYFAQQLASALGERCLSLPPAGCLRVIEGVVTQVPAALAGEETPVAFRREMLRGSKGFPSRFSARGEGIGRRSAAVLAVSLGLLTAAWTAEGFRYREIAKRAEARMVEAAGGDPRLVNGLVRNNIRQKYRAIDERQRKIRQKILALGSLTGREVRLDTLVVDRQGYRARLQVDPRRIAALVRLASKAGLPARQEAKTGQLGIEERW